MVAHLYTSLQHSLPLTRNPRWRSRVLTARVAARTNGFPERGDGASWHDTSDAPTCCTSRPRWRGSILRSVQEGRPRRGEEAGDTAGEVYLGIAQLSAMLEPHLHKGAITSMHCAGRASLSIHLDVQDLDAGLNWQPYPCAACTNWMERRSTVAWWSEMRKATLLLPTLSMRAVAVYQNRASNVPAASQPSDRRRARP